MIDKSFIESVRDLGVGAMQCQVIQVEGHEPLIAVPVGRELTSITDHRPERPLRLKQRVAFTDVTSFVSYFEKFEEGASQIFASVTLGQGNHVKAIFTAVMDYHEPKATDPDHGSNPNWCQHIATFTLTPTVEWATWRSKDKQVMKQQDFAEFIEANLPDIEAPKAGDLLDMTRNLEAKMTVEFESAVRQSDGRVILKYVEDKQGAALKGQLPIYEEFMLRVVPFEGTDPYGVSALLRYRITQGVLTFWYELLRPHKTEQEAARAAVAAIEGKTGAPVLMGAIG